MMAWDRLLRPGAVTALVALAMTAVFVLDSALPGVILFPYYFILVIAASLVVSPLRVAVLAAWALLLSWARPGRSCSTRATAPSRGPGSS
jgi:hypothetical protein